MPTQIKFLRGNVPVGSGNPYLHTASHSMGKTLPHSTELDHPQPAATGLWQNCNRPQLKVPGTQQDGTGTVRVKGKQPPMAHACHITGDPALLYLDVAIVGPFVAIHTLHRGRLPLHQMDSKQRLEPHGVTHMGVMRRQVHPANDEQSIHLQQTQWSRQGALSQSTSAHQSLCPPA